MKNFPIYIVLFLVLVFFQPLNAAAAGGDNSPKTALQPPDITDHFPVINARAVDRAEILTVTFDSDMNGASINGSTFVVNGSISVRHPGNVSYNNPTRTATYTPLVSYASGEVVTVTLTTDIESSGAEKLAEPYMWSFTVQTTGGTGRFDFGPEIPFADMPVTVALGDFNGDGRLDISSVSYDPNVITVIFNNGDSSFVVDSSYIVGSLPLHLCAGDFNGDGDMDIAASNFSSNDVTVLLNLGDGTFVQQAPVPAGVGPRSVISFDADGDGDIDLATANQNAGEISVLFNDGAGLMTLDSSYLIGDTIFFVAVADVDTNGNFDLMVSSSSADSAYVLINLGGGIYSPAVRYNISGNHPRGTAAADFDGDGTPDIVTANDYSTDLSVLYNQGDGTFGGEAVYSTGTGPFAITTGDLDGDSDIDLVTSNGGYGSTSILINAGDGSFELDGVYNVANKDAYGSALGDLDGDGDLDMASACLNPQRIMIMFNKNRSAIDSTLPPRNASSVPVTDDIVIFFGLDFDGATITDSTVIVRSRLLGLVPGTLARLGQSVIFQPDYPFLSGDVITVTVTDGIDVFSPDPIAKAYSWTFTTDVGGGVGDFKDAWHLAVGSQPRVVCPADLNNDGRPDLAVANATSNTISVLINNGDTTFSHQIAGPVDRIPYTMDAGDIDNDGDIDLITGSLGDHSISICYNDGNGLCESTTKITEGDKTSSVSIADYNGDGWLDISAGKVYSDSIYVYLNDGQGGFPVSGVPYYAQGAPYEITSVDIDGDIDIDLVSANYSDYNYITILYNNGSGEFSRRSIKEVFEHNAEIADSAHAIFAGDFDRDGFADLAVGNVWANNISILLNDGTGSFPEISIYDVLSWPHAICGADFDGDGDMDLGCADQTIPGYVTILENYGDGTFAYYKDHRAGDSVHDVAPVDIDGDGDVDIIAVNGLSHDISILFNKDSIRVTAVENPLSVPSGDSCLLQVNVSGDPDSVVLYHRLGGVTDWIDTALVSSDTVYQTNIPTDIVGVRSTAYYFRAFQREVAITEPASNPEIAPDYIRSELTDMAVPGLLGDVYQMTGFPIILNPGHPDSIFLDDFGPYGNSRWRMGRWNPDKLPEPGYDDYTEIDSLSRGEGFWLYSRAGVHLDASGISVIPDTTIGDTGYSRYELRPGWNQISTPFGFPVLWDRRIAEVDIESAIYTYSVTETDTSYLSVDTLHPFAGYFLRNTAGSVRTLHLPYIQANLMPPGPAISIMPQIDFWQARLSLESGGVSDISNLIGVRADAADGRDRYDLSEPPIPPGRFVSLSFERVNDAGKTELIAGDFRKPDSGWTFDILLRGNVDAPVSLKLTDSTLLPPEFSIVLKDAVSGKTYDIPRQGAIKLPGRLTLNGVKYQLLVGDKDFIAGQTGSHNSLPDKYRISQNYPNPFNPSTKIDFELPLPSHVRLDVYNILGQRIATLVEHYLPAGSHSATWDGRDGENNAVASGIYFYRIEAGDFVAKRKMMLLK